MFGFWPAASENDDIVVFQPGATNADADAMELLRFNMLRQQDVQPGERPNRSLADFIAPRDCGRLDHIGAFAVTAGVGADLLVAEYERDHDDYHAIMVKALADRLAEATAEYLHAEARRQWRYGQDEQLSPDELRHERYRGIRPAFGYPACPDHSEKFKLFDLLEARAIGLDLTESAAMTPAASVSGLYFAHPQAHYFTVGRVAADQVEGYASRRGWQVSEVERWLGPSLAYEAGTGVGLATVSCRTAMSGAGHGVVEGSEGPSFWNIAAATWSVRFSPSPQGRWPGWGPSAARVMSLYDHVSIARVDHRRRWSITSGNTDCSKVGWRSST